MYELPDTYADAFANDLVSKYQFVTKPVWVWASNGERVLWTNEAGCRFFKTKSIPDLLKRKFRRISPATVQIASAARRIKKGETDRLQLRFLTDMKPLLLTAELQPIKLADGTKAILVIGIDWDKQHVIGSRKKALRRFVKMFSRGDAAIAILDDDGAIEEQSTVFEKLNLKQSVLNDFAKDLRQDNNAHATLSLKKGSVRSVPFVDPHDETRKILVCLTSKTASTKAATEKIRKKASAKTLEPPIESAAPPVGLEARSNKAPVLPSAISNDAPIEDTPVDSILHSTERTGTDIKGPIRFLFKLDADGKIASISPDFCDAFGDPTGNIIGQNWQALCERFLLDPTGIVGKHISGRAIWTETLNWPLSDPTNTDGSAILRAPVNMTAMPVFDRNRVFEGYRGYGTVWLDKAQTTPEIDLVQSTTIPALNDNGPEDETTPASAITSLPVINEPTSPAEGTEDNDTIISLPANDTRSNDNEQETAIAATRENEAQQDMAMDSQPSVPFELSNQEEAGAPKVASTNRDDNETDRPPLSSPDEKAFRQIADALQAKLGEEEDEKTMKHDLGQAQKGNVGSDHDRVDDAEDETTDVQLKANDEISFDLFAASAVEGVDNYRQDPADTEQESIVEQSLSDDDAASFTIPNALPADENEAIETGVLDRLPLGLIVSRDRNVIFANQSVLDFLGYATLDQFRDSGGVRTLFHALKAQEPGTFQSRDILKNLILAADQQADDPLAPQHADIVKANGDITAVDVRLQSGEWRGEAALLMAITAPDQTTSAELGRDHTITQLLGQSTDIMDIASDGILILEKSGKLIHANASSEALFGRDRRDLCDHYIADLFAPESQKAISDYLDGLTSNGVASVLNDGREVIAAEANGGYIPLFITIGRINSADQHTDPVYCAVMRDITHWKKAEEELIEARRVAETANQQKSDFLAKVSHEIRTPLNAIIGFSEVMMEERFGTLDNPRYREYAKDIYNSGTHLVSIVNDLLDLSKIEAGKLDLSFSAVSLNAIVQECVATMQPDANRDRIIIRTSLRDNLPAVVADARSIRQIMLNLLSNAVKFTPSGGQVIVSSALESNGEVALRIRDTGVGMNEQDLEQAMQPFQQVGASTHGRLPGTGLGLPLTKALVEANRALFSIDSRVDYGTLIEVTFPTARVLAE